MTDQYRDLAHRLVALALGPTPPPAGQLVAELHELLRAHAIDACAGGIQAATNRLGAKNRSMTRRARGWLARRSPLRDALEAAPVHTRRVATVRVDAEGQAWLPVPTETDAHELVTAGPCRVTVEPIEQAVSISVDGAEPGATVRE